MPAVHAFYIQVLMGLIFAPMCNKSCISKPRIPVAAIRNFVHTQIIWSGIMRTDYAVFCIDGIPYRPNISLTVCGIGTPYGVT